MGFESLNSWRCDVKILVAIKPVPNPDEKVKIKGRERDRPGQHQDGREPVLRDRGRGGAADPGEADRRSVVVTVGRRRATSRCARRLRWARTGRCWSRRGGPRLAGGGEGAGEVVADEKADLVLMGKQSVDDDNNQVGRSWRRCSGGRRRRSRRRSSSRGQQEGERDREVDGGLETIEVALPAVVTADCG